MRKKLNSGNQWSWQVPCKGTDKFLAYVSSLALDAELTVTRAAYLVLAVWLAAHDPGTRLKDNGAS
ncbi:hypothetical protein EMIT0P228_70073 [Pseudomonas brassicacearum]